MSDVWIAVASVVLACSIFGDVIDNLLRAVI